MTPEKTITVDEDVYDEARMNQLECCGIEELYNLGKDPNALLLYVNHESSKRAMIIFHDAVINRNGSRLAYKIRRNKLGSVQSSKKVVNPNTTNVIQMWIWYPDFTALEDYCSKLRLNPY